MQGARERPISAYFGRAFATSVPAVLCTRGCPSCTGYCAPHCPQAMTSGAQQPGTGSLTDALVFQYLKKRGYLDAAEQLPAQAKAVSEQQLARHFPDKQLARLFPDMDAAVQDRLLLYGVAWRGGPDYGAAYAQLRDWVHGSLDLYKVRTWSRGGGGRCRRASRALTPLLLPALPVPHSRS